MNHVEPFSQTLAYYVSQLCDRRKPSCTACLDTSGACAYVDRKRLLTVPELEDILRRLERRYADYLETTAKNGRRRKVPVKVLRRMLEPGC